MYARRCILALLVAVAIFSCADAKLEKVLFTVALRGDSVVPPVEITAHRGEGLCQYDLDSKKLTCTVQHSVAEATDAFIKGNAQPGQNGAETILDFDDPEDSPMSDDKTLNTAEEAALLGGGLYIVITTEDFPEGEIRGNILREPHTLEAVLSTDQEVPAGKTNETGIAIFKYESATKTLSWNIEHNVETPIGGALHGPAKVGVVGNVSMRFPNAASPMTGDEIITQPQEDAIFAGLMYVNIYTQAAPGGLIRGQVVVVENEGEPEAEFESCPEDDPDCSGDGGGSSGGLGAGAIAGIVIGSVVVLAIVAVGGIIGYRQYKAKKGSFQRVPVTDDLDVGGSYVPPV